MNYAEDRYVGWEFAEYVLSQIGTFQTPESHIGDLSVIAEEGTSSTPSSVTVLSDGTPIGSIAHLGYLLLDDERNRTAVLDGLRNLGVRVATPLPPREEASNSEWLNGKIPNVYVDWRADWHTGAFKLHWTREAVTSTTTMFANYNSTTKTLWVADTALVAPACVFAARLGLVVHDIALPPKRWLPGKSPVSPRPTKVVEFLPKNLFTVRELERFAQPSWYAGEEPTELVESLATTRQELFPDHSYIGAIDACRVCSRPAGRFRAKICADDLAYCHRCLRWATAGLPNAWTLERAIARGTTAARLLAIYEFGGEAFIESQLSSISGDPEQPVTAAEIDRRILLRIAITRHQLPWTRVLIDAGLADDGVRLSRGTVLKAADGHLCTSMLEKAVDDFLHNHGIDHEREPLYPFDEQFNPNTRRRADWRLSDGTIIEMWGMPNDPVYAAKMAEKIELAKRHRLRLIGITAADVGRLNEIFARWTKR